MSENPSRFRRRHAHTVFPLPGLRVLVWLVLAGSLMGGAARATWSICAVDTATGEVALASATCLSNFNLKAATPVLVVGMGVGVAQASLGPVSLRQIIWDELHKGTDPAIIMQLLEAADPGFESRQYGIVDLQGRVATHTGTQDGAWAGHRAGTAGTISYSIQGNVLTGLNVVLEAEYALLNTTGDLAERVMAAMLAARAMGGDGRCSCSNSNPPGCGSPPPFFERSAYVGYVLLGRIGDEDGANCDDSGCAKGVYYLDLSVSDGNDDTDDPVIRLAQMFDDWRASLDDLPDHLQSEAAFGRPTMPADGQTETAMEIVLRDWQGDAITHGGALVTVTHAPGSDGVTTIGPVTDNGDGTYDLPITAGVSPGTDLFDVAAVVPEQSATLYPYPLLESVWPLEADATSISSSAPVPVQLTLTEPGPLEQSGYLVAMSVTGTSPGVDIGGAHLPLNYDPTMYLSIVRANHRPFVGTNGAFDTAGLALASFDPVPGWLAPLVGRNIYLAFLTLNPIDAASNPVIFLVTP